MHDLTSPDRPLSLGEFIQDQHRLVTRQAGDKYGEALTLCTLAEAVRQAGEPAAGRTGLAAALQ